MKLFPSNSTRIGFAGTACAALSSARNAPAASGRTPAIAIAQALDRGNLSYNVLIVESSLLVFNRPGAGPLLAGTGAATSKVGTQESQARRSSRSGSIFTLYMTTSIFVLVFNHRGSPRRFAVEQRQHGLLVKMVGLEGGIFAAVS